jgi:RNA polymerase sigma-70 factor (ECF subfamily)
MPLRPEARYELCESISLALVTALQALPPRQVAVLVLRDVLGFHATEVAEILDSTVDSVASAPSGCAPPCGDGCHRPPPSNDRPRPAPAGRRFDLVPTRANGQPAFGACLRAPDGVRHGTGLYVLTLAGDRIGAMTRFESTLLPWFGLARSLPSR